MGKYKNISVVLGCVLCTIVAQANSPQMSEDKAMQYAQKVILDRLGEKDRELTTSEQKIANEIVKSYLVLQDEYERSLTQPQMIWTSSTTDRQSELLARKLLELKHRMYEFFLDKSFGIDYRSDLAYPAESSEKSLLSDESADSHMDSQANYDDGKVDEK